MIHVDLTDSKTLEEYYSRLRKLQEEAHGKDYCVHHDEVLRCLGVDDDYVELGVHQGASLAAVVLRQSISSGSPRATGIDVDLSRIMPYWHLFGLLAAKPPGIHVGLVKGSSLDPVNSRNTGVLLIDSKHTYRHLKKELELHAPMTHKAIVLHDTNGVPELRKAALEYVSSHPEWKVDFEHRSGAGCMTLRRS